VSQALKAAVAGLGSMGSNHVRVWGELEGVELVGVADPSEGARARATRGRNYPAFANVEEMLDRCQPDLLSIATPTSTHEAVVQLATARGVNILVEKPVAADAAAAERIATLVKASGVVATVGHVERFNPAMLELRRRLAAGESGEIIQIGARRVGPFPARIRDVGVVQDLATHDLDQLRHLLGTEVEVLFAQGASRIRADHEDLVSIVGRAVGGVILTVDVNWLTPRKVRETTVIGDAGMFIADSLTQDLFFFENNWADTEWGALGALRGVSEGKMVRFALKRVEPLRAELASFVNAVANGEPVESTMADGLQALRLAEATLESMRSTKPVFLPSMS
jgi:UDP-N-acetylglucosamine 3-dehydrogenase